MSLKTFKIIIKGQVQGVGFRPFVYGLAQKFNLKGVVYNNEQGVIIYINAQRDKLNLFLEELLQNPPPVALIISHQFEEVEKQEFGKFKIISSKKENQVRLPLTPDFAICSNCKIDVKNPKNKRFQYAFTTCVHCGPRYAITQKFPFERSNTTINKFKMCSECQQEYDNPNDRRFHSQTNTCSTCGIKLKLVNNNGEIIENSQEKIIEKVAQLIKEGQILAIKNTSGYLLCCDATNEKTIQKLREKKQRPTKPFALLYPSIELIKEHFEPSLEEERSLISVQAPIVILSKTSKPLRFQLQEEKPQRFLPKNIAPNLNQLGVMLPSSALLYLLMSKINSPIIATSGNIHGLPIISDEKTAQKELAGVADYFLHHDLEITFPQDDSVLRFSGKNQIILRRSRGFAPNYLKYQSDNQEQVLAMGADLKSAFAFKPSSHVYISQYFGNLANYEVFERYSQTIKSYKNLFESKAQTILIDKHAQYQSHQLGKELAQEWQANYVEIQHHKAHFASILGEHDLFKSKEKVLGVIWDGTGLGGDNAIWGGEFFVYQNQNMERLPHFEYFDWIAQDKMAKEPRLSLLSLLPEQYRQHIRHKFSHTEWNIYNKLLQKNTLKTSSMGRVFDAVASLLEIKDKNTFEGESAMILEDYAFGYKKNNYIDFFKEKTTNKTVTFQFLIQNAFLALKEGVSKEQIAASFIYTLANVIIEMAQKNQIKTIACSGGVFQNAFLIKCLENLVEENKLELKLHKDLSSNDENIAFGQLMYYQNIKQEKYVSSSTRKNQEYRITT